MNTREEMAFTLLLDHLFGFNWYGRMRYKGLPVVTIHIAVAFDIAWARVLEQHRPAGVVFRIEPMSWWRRYVNTNRGWV